MADNVLGRLGAAAAKADERLRDPALAERIPGRSLAVVGYAALLAAVLLDLLPGGHLRSSRLAFGWDASPLGHVWDVAFLVLAGAALASRVTPAAARLRNAALHTAVAALALAQAYLVLDLRVVPLLVLAGAAVLCYDAWRTGLAARAREVATNALAAIPARTTTGLGLVLVALVVSKLPGDPVRLLGGVVVLGSSVTSLLWTLVLVAAIGAGIAADRGAAPPEVADAATLLVVAEAVVLFNLSLVPLLWALGATVAAYDRLRRRPLAAPPVALAVGVPLCVLALSFTWSRVQSGGYFMGGYESSYSSYYGGYVSDYNVTKYYMPGFSYAGSGLTQGPSWLSFSPLVVAALLALLVAALWRLDVPAWAPLAVVGAVALWTLVHLDTDVLGPWAFLPGLALVAVAALRWPRTAPA